MSLLDKLKDPNIINIVFIEINYKDAILVSKKEYISDYYINIPEGLVEGGNLLDVEHRLNEIPYFARSLDLIESKINKGSYTLKIENTDNYYTDFFKNNFFKNQAINFYLTVEDSPFEKLQIAQGTIKDFTINENDILLKVDEINLYQKNINPERFNYPNQVENLEDEVKPYINGNIKNFDISSYNINKPPVEEFRELENSEIDSLEYLEDSNLIFFKTKKDVENVRKYLSIGDTIAVPALLQEQKVTAKIKNLFPVSDTNTLDTNLAIEVENFSVPRFILSGNVNLFFKKSDESAKYFSNEFLLTKKNDDDIYYDPKYRSSLITSQAPAGSTSFTIQDDWGFLKENDVLFISKKVSNYIVDDEWYVEEVIVDSYDPSTKTITIKDYAPIAYSRFTADNWYVAINKVHSLTTEIENGAEFNTVRCRNMIELDSLGLSLNGSDFSTSTDEKGYIKYNGIKFEADGLTAATGNLHQVYFLERTVTRTITNSFLGIETGTSTPVVVKYIELEKVDDVYYGLNTARWIIYYYKGATSQDIIDYLDQYNLDADPADQTPFTYTLLNDQEVKDNKTITQPNGDYIFPLMFSNQKINKKSFISFNLYEKTSTSGNGLVPVSFGLYFNKDTDTDVPSSNFFVKGLAVSINSSDTKNDVLNKIVATINNENIINQNLYLFAVRVGDKIIIKCSRYNKYHLNLKSCNMPNGIIVKTPQQYVDWYDVTLNNNDDVIVSYDQDLFNMCYKYYLSPGASGLYEGYLYAKRIKPDNSLTSNHIYTFGSPLTGSLTNQLDKLIAFDSGLESLNLSGKDTIFISDLLTGNDDNNFLTSVEKFDSSSGYVYVRTSLSDVFDEYYTSSDNEDFVEIFKNVPISGVYANYRDYSHISDILENLFEYFNITEFSSADLTDLRNNHPNFITYLIQQDEELKLFEILKDYLKSFNLYTYIDKTGTIRIKFWDIYETVSSNKLDYNALLDLKIDYSSMKYSKYKLGILKDIKNDTYTIKDITNDFLNQLSTDTNWVNNLEYDSYIQEDFLDQLYNGNSYSSLLGDKFLSKLEEIEFIGDLDLLDLELGDYINIENYDKIDVNNIYKVISIETNGLNTKINALRLVQNPPGAVLVSELGEFITDENGNAITGEE